jgi:hypothetical protein
MCDGMGPGAAIASAQGANYEANRALIALLQRTQANFGANEILVHQFVSDDSTHQVVLNRDGKKISDRTEKVESVFSSGTWYFRVVERNGKPLSPEKQASLQRHQEAVSERARGFDFVFDLRDGNPRDSVYSALPICCLIELFENRLVRREQINGHDNVVIESVPKANPGWAAPEDRTALDWKETTWIDVGDLMPTRIEVELLNDRGFLLKGSTEIREFIKMQFASDKDSRSTDSVWLEQTKKDHSILKFLWKTEIQDSEDTSYNFRRFKADMRVLANSMREVPNQPTSPKP